MTHEILQYILLALFFVFVIAATQGRAPLWKRVLIAAVPVVCVICCAVNLGGAYFSSVPDWYHILTTGVYVLFWVIFTALAHRSRFMTGCCVFFSCAMLCAAVTGIGVRTLRWDILTIPAVVLTPFSTLPMYGVSRFADWTGMELVSLALALPWLGYSLYLRQRQKK